MTLKRELFALVCLSNWYLVMAVWLFFAVLWVCLMFVIVVFPDHTHLLFFMSIASLNIKFSSVVLLEYQ